jgi:hypothetical protein
VMVVSIYDPIIELLSTFSCSEVQLRCICPGVRSKEPERCLLATKMMMDIESLGEMTVVSKFGLGMML